MIATSVALLEVFCIASLCLLGVGIGQFYKMKFGESTHSWLLGVGALLGLGGQSMYLLPSVPSLVPDLVFLVGAIFLAIGTFWLWNVMLGPRR
ncbi:MAG: hypothetical protein H6686_08695 [Fibrobacteria bacterium]|nr:hypothetical protein [Fibrobacteria bacterium]